MSNVRSAALRQRSPLLLRSLAAWAVAVALGWAGDAAAASSAARCKGGCRPVSHLLAPRPAAGAESGAVLRQAARLGTALVTGFGAASTRASAPTATCGTRG